MLFFSQGDESLIFDYESEFVNYQQIFTQEEIQKMQIEPKTSMDLDVDICKSSKSSMHNGQKNKINAYYAQ